MSFYKTKLFLLTMVLVVAIGACHNVSEQKTANTTNDATPDWNEKLHKKLSMFGHRNWILVTDKAFPEQNSPGFEYVYVDEPILPVFKKVLDQVNSSSHVKPIIYRDKELDYITEEQAKGVTLFRQEATKIIGSQPVQSILHNSVFEKLDSEAKLFTVLVIKTNETLPYSSFFLQLDCGYWSEAKEKQLRSAMEK